MSRTALGPIVRKDWLDKLGLQPPKTVDDWHTMLKAFKEGDPNGNGKADEFGLAPVSSPMMETLLYGMGMGNEWFQVDGKVKYTPIDPLYKDYLQVMAQWYKEGLIDPDFLVSDVNTQNARIANGTLGVFENYLSSFTTYEAAAKVNDPNAKFIGIQYPTMNAGEKPLLSQQVGLVDRITGMAITVNNKHLEETVKWLDYLYTEEGQQLVNFGPEGMGYDMVDGKIELKEEVKTITKPSNDIFQSVGKYGLIFDHFPQVKTKEYLVFTTSTPEQLAAAELWTTAVNKQHLPGIAPLAEDAANYATKLESASTYMKEMRGKFIMGLEPLDKWDAYVAELKKFGIEEVIAILQKSLDLYNKR